MASPTFNGDPIFDSRKADGTRFPEGVLWVPDYNVIRQRLHFNGESGDRYLQHGAPDRPWIYKGILTTDSLVNLKAMIDAIYAAIDDGSAGQYRTLEDSFGNQFQHAQVHSVHVGEYHVTSGGFAALGVVVNGIIQGMVRDGGT